MSSPLPDSVAMGTIMESFLRLLHIEIARFTTNLIVYVSVALIIGLPRMAVSHYVVPCSPDFPLNCVHMEIHVQFSYAFSHLAL